MRKDACDFIRPLLPTLRPLEPTAEQAIDVYLLLFAPWTTLDTAERIRKTEWAQNTFGEKWPRIGNSVRDWLHKGLAK